MRIGRKKEDCRGCLKRYDPTIRKSLHILCSIDLEEPFGDSYELVYFYVFDISSGRVQEKGRILRVMLHQCSLHLGTCSRCMVGMIIARSG